LRKRLACAKRSREIAAVSVVGQNYSTVATVGGSGAIDAA